MMNAIQSHVAVACAAALVASTATCLAITGQLPALPFSSARAPVPPAPGTRQIDLFNTTMNDVMGRLVTIRRTERDPGSGSAPHRHPGSHTFGYVLEGTYEVKIDAGPVQRLGPGQTFDEPPNALHAVSRNGSSSEVLKYLVIQVSDPTKPQTVPEK